MIRNNNYRYSQFYLRQPNAMKYLLPLFLMAQICSAQTTTTESYKENRWILNSGINLPAVKFHLSQSSDPIESKGFLELFSSFGVGLGINYGQAKFVKDVDLNRILENKTEFVNLIGFQFGVLYSSKVNEEEENSNTNYFSLYGGINVLDLQIGGGKELGAKYQNSNGWFISLSYGIPIYKLTGGGAYLFKKRSRSNHENKNLDLVGY